MKRLFSLLMLFMIVVLLCSCSANLANDACKLADELVYEWNSEAFTGCTYSSEYHENYNGQGSYYIVNARYPTEVVENSVSPDYIKGRLTQEIFNELYPQLQEVFSETEVTVMFTLANQSGTDTYSGIIDGEITYFNK